MRKQILFTGIGQAELVEKEFLKPMAADEVIVRTEFSAISAGTERANLVAEPNTASKGKFPWAEGYSSVGIITEVGSAVKGYKVGDRVLVYHGFHASYNKVKASALTLVPDGVDPKDAALVIIAAMGLGGVRKLNVEIGESAMIIGLGLLGMFSVEFARLAGANPVIVSDLSPERRELALKLGADYALDPTAPDYVETVKKLTNGRGVNAIVEVTGVSVALRQALDCASYMARISLLGCTRIPDCDINYYQQVHRPGVKLIGAHNMVRPKHESFPGHWTMHDDCACILDLLAAKRIEAAPIISEVHAPSECAEVYARLANDRNFPLGVLFDWTEVED